MTTFRLDDTTPVIINHLPVILPKWPAPKMIKACTTTRLHGYSPMPFEAFNLSLNPDIHQTSTLQNRTLLEKSLNLPQAPTWISQCHGTRVIDAAKNNLNSSLETADASFSQTANVVCAVLTADCLPILVCNRSGTEVAAIHAGWRGLCDGIIESSIANLHSQRKDLLVWLGPAISPLAFTVGAEVRAQFIAHNPQAASCFTPSTTENYFMADLYALARLRLTQLEIEPAHIFGGHHCTMTQSEWFYSYRRDGDQSGRMASLIWIDTEAI